MVIYIKDNEIITEKEISKETKKELIEQGFQEVKVANVEIPSDYRYEHFVKENGVWVYKPDNK